jgi:PAS domain S-box-containing protein
MTVSQDIDQAKEQLICELEELRAENAKLKTINQAEALLREAGREGQLAVELQQITAALSHAVEGISRLDAQGRYRMVNQAYAQITGYQPEEMIGMDWQKTVYPDDLEQLIAAYQRMLNTGKVNVEARGVRRDGSIFYKHLTMVATYDAQQQLLGHYCFMKDISDRKQAEVELQRQQQDLARSNAELQQFAYVASHDLQEPLRMITSYLELLQRRYRGQLDAKADLFIDFAVDGAARMQTLINDLLTYSRVGTGGKPLEQADCTEILQNALLNLQVAIAESQAVITQDPVPVIRGDSVQLTQLFQNLISNAIKFRQQTIPQIHIGCEQRNGQWVFSVRDNGIGIEPQYLDRIFLIFQRLHSRTEYPGTGIGLAVCKRIVERHGGQLWVESSFGEGSTFYFTFPEYAGHAS